MSDFTETDDRIVAALRSMGIPFEYDEDGDVKIVVPTDNGRTQKVYIKALPIVFGDLELRSIYSCAYFSRDDLPRRTIEFVLAQNSDVPFGAWRTFLDGGEIFLEFEAKLPAVISPNTLLAVIKMIGQVADDVESTLSVSDVH